jgi:diguanylate cyclase (GGDEF)-like protein
LPFGAGADRRGTRSPDEGQGPWRSLVLTTALVAALCQGAAALHSAFDGAARAHWILDGGALLAFAGALLALRGRIASAARLLFAELLVTVMLLVLIAARGTQDPAMLAFTALAVMASMVPGKHWFLVGLSLTLGAVVVIYGLELSGLTAGHVVREGRSTAGDAFDVLVVIAGTAAVSRKLSQTLFTALARAQQLAEQDHLTGLPNLRRLLWGLGERLAQAQQTGAPVWLLLVDLDRFRFVNNLGGPSAGDAALREVGRRLGAFFPGEELVGRQGGNEFLAVLGGGRSRAELVSRLPSLLAAVCEPLEVEGRRYELTASAGLAGFPEDGADAATLLRRAGLSLAQAKRQGGNTWVAFDAALGLRAEEDVRVSQELQLAARRGEMVLHYQPIYASRTRRLLGFEALLRWRRGGEIRQPGSFIQHAEETGYIVEIGEWVLKEACAQLSRWRAQSGLDLTMAVNVSARQAADAHLPAAVAQALAASGLPAAALTLELTESAMMAQEVDPRALVERLRGLGVQLALDDFGTGYSSLAYLRRLPLDLLKIDRGFLADIPAEPQATLVLDAIIRLAQELHITVVAEGVEREAQLGHLEEQGCERLQGFLLSEPLEPAAVAALLSQ